MSGPHIIIWMAVFAVAVSFLVGKKATAGALAVAWLFGEVVYQITGDSLAVQFYLYPDIFVLAVIFAQARQSLADWAVVALYPAAWTFYVADIDPSSKWWALYYITLAQLLIAAADSFLAYRREHRAVSDRPATPTGGEFSLAWARGSG